MKGIQNALQFLYENWITILVCIGLIAGIARKTVNFFSKSDEEKITIAKSQIQQTILKMISDAEYEWDEWSSAGSIKRSQVIAEIYEKYPILSKIKDQEALTEWIDKQINDSLKTLREIVKENKPEISTTE